ncbi:MAG: hypothetical protein EAS48_10610 [Chryseobacterium sp.]|nr:MAG: hypothetical protein EAS48_10610 [Chryseobacterium sp.]
MKKIYFLLISAGLTAQTAASDPKALELLNNVLAHYNSNSPQSLAAYHYKNYMKAAVDVHPDSTALYRRYANNGGIASRIENYKPVIDKVLLDKVLKESGLALWERSLETDYTAAKGEKIRILDSKVSGLEKSLPEFVAAYSNINRLPREVMKENRSLYIYHSADSVTLDNRKTYVIDFRESKKQRPWRMRENLGKIYIDAETYGVTRLETRSADDDEHKIWNWKQVDGKWFLADEDFRIKLSRTVPAPKDVDNPPFGLYLSVRSVYSDISAETHADHAAAVYTYTVVNDDGSKMQELRPIPLTERERNTYKAIDRIGKERNFQVKAESVAQLLHGDFRYGWLDFDLGKIVGLNRYESVRLGLAAKLNERFSKVVSPNAYFAYGFRDHTWKYGVGIDVRTSQERDAFFRAEYNNDIDGAGHFSQYLWVGLMKLMNSGANLNNQNYYSYKGFRISYQDDISNSLTVNLSAAAQKEKALFDYSYKQSGKEFDDFSTRLSVRYSPFSRNIMTPKGKYIVQQGYPELYLNYEKGWKALDGENDYSRFDALAHHRFTTPAGITGIRLYGGLQTGSAPIWKAFEAGGLRPEGRDGFFSHFNLTSYLGFTTMESGKYYKDRFAAYYLTQTLPWHFKSFGRNISSFSFVYKGIIGDFKNKADHDFKFEPVDKLYQEIGLEWNNFLSSRFNLGFFYRVGHYNTGNFKDNFAVQLKLKFLGF